MWKAGVDIKSAGAGDDDDDWETDADFVVWIVFLRNNLRWMNTWWIV